jgi:hypothetical protein
MLRIQLFFLEIRTQRVLMPRGERSTGKIKEEPFHLEALPSSADSHTLLTSAGDISWSGGEGIPARRGAIPRGQVTSTDASRRDGPTDPTPSGSSRRTKDARTPRRFQGRGLYSNVRRARTLPDILPGTLHFVMSPRFQVFSHEET